jgi:DNA-binding SARP family transcriptional activator
MNILKRYYKSALSVFILTILLGEFLVISGQPDDNYGLKFASYEVTKDLRTSLNLNPDLPFKVKGPFSISFKFKYYRVTNTYGYIFRIIANNSKSFDLISKTSFSQDFDIKFVAVAVDTKIHFNLDEIFTGNENGWINTIISFFPEKNIISLTLNGITKTDSVSLQETKAINILFGASKNFRFATSDVPPIIVKDIRVTIQEKDNAFWKLDQYSNLPVLDLVNGKRASVENPVWEIDDHSRWKLRFTFRTDHYPQIAFNDKESKMYIVEKEQLHVYNIIRDTLSSVRYSSGKPLMSMSNQLIYNPYKNELWQYVINESIISKYNFKTNSWNTSNHTTAEPSYWHNNKVFSPVDHNLLTFGGYGYYTYKNLLHLYDDIKETWIVPPVNGFIRPRYLAAMGNSYNPDEILIFGGYGNESGKQELSPESLFDLFSLNLRNFQFIKLWEMTDVTNNFALSNSLIVDSVEKCFYALCYPGQKYSSELYLAKFPVSTPGMTIISDSIPYSFQDTESYCDLFFSKPTSQLIAVTSSFVDNKQSEISIYSLDYPPVNARYISTSLKNSFSIKPWLIILTVVIIGFVLFFILSKLNLFSGLMSRKSVLIGNVEKINKNIKLSEEEKILGPAETDPDPGHRRYRIQFLGGFRITDKKGEDITGLFTPTLRQLFVMILLYSQDRGVTSIFLRDNIWLGKSKESARNIRGVYIGKLRMLLKEIGNVKIQNDNSNWTIQIGPDVYYDFHRVIQLIRNSRQTMEFESGYFKELLFLASKGPLLPDLEYDWLDKFKADYSNEIIDILLGFSRRLDLQKDIKLAIEIADSVFSNDHLNEDALQLKCKVLNNDGKHSLAKNVYESFAREYFNSIGSPFERSFNDLIS